MSRIQGVGIYMNDNISLNNLTDRQKIWLSQISYLNINEQGRNKILNGGMTLHELEGYIIESNKPFVGNAWLGDEKFNSIAGTMTGENDFPTQLDVLNSLIACGLGDLTITNVSDEQKKISSSGFQALTFQDSYGNTGISYRGSDFDFSKGGIRDWVESDVLEYFKNDSTQRKEALEYFNANKNQNGNNYVYGHSLGGNLTSHVYSENYSEINEAFVINGNPINQKLLDTPEKVEAFNDSKKYNCNIICGDIVGHFKSCKSYENNVNYIRNNETMKLNAISSHLVQAATFDENGNFIKVSKEEMKEKTGFVMDSLMKFVQQVREVMNDIENKLDKTKDDIRQRFEEYRDNLYDSFNKKIKELNINVDFMKTNYTNQDEQNYLNNFREAAKMDEMKAIEEAKTSMMQRDLYKENYIQNDQFMDYNGQQVEESYRHIR